MKERGKESGKKTKKHKSLQTLLSGVGAKGLSGCGEE